MLWTLEYLRYFKISTPVLLCTPIWGQYLRLARPSCPVLSMLSCTIFSHPPYFPHLVLSQSHPSAGVPPMGKRGRGWARGRRGTKAALSCPWERSALRGGGHCNANEVCLDQRYRPDIIWGFPASPECGLLPTCWVSCASGLERRAVFQSQHIPPVLCRPMPLIFQVRAPHSQPP